MEGSDDDDKEVEEVKADESEQGSEEQKHDESEPEAERSEKIKSKGPAAEEKRKTGLNKVGVVISVLGVLGLIGAVLLDPFMNIVDSSHPAGMNIGIMQMIAIAVAALVLVAGVMLSIAPRKGHSTD